MLFTTKMNKLFAKYQKNCEEERQGLLVNEVRRGLLAEVETERKKLLAEVEAERKKLQEERRQLLAKVEAERKKLRKEREGLLVEVEAEREELQEECQKLQEEREKLQEECQKLQVEHQGLQEERQRHLEKIKRFSTERDEKRQELWNTIQNFIKKPSNGTRMDNGKCYYFFKLPDDCINILWYSLDKIKDLGYKRVYPGITFSFKDINPKEYIFINTYFVPDDKENCSKYPTFSELSAGSHDFKTLLICC